MPVMNRFDAFSLLLQRTAHAFRIQHRALAIAPLNSLFRAATHERLLGFALRNYFWFLVSHFWLLSEAFASLFVFLLPPHAASAGRIW